MIFNYLKSAIRHFVRHKYFSILNIVGLAIGFSATILLSLFVWQELSYDTFHEKADNIARVTMHMHVQGQDRTVAVTGTKVGPAFVRDFPEVEKAVRIFHYPATVTQGDDYYNEDTFIYADSTFFDIFSFELLQGDPKKALTAPRSLLLTPKSAKKYFGDDNPLNKTLSVDGKEYTVVGIVKEAPNNSQIKYDFIASFSSLRAAQEEIWWSANYYTYVILNNLEQIPQLEAKIFDYMKGQSEETNMSGDNFLTYYLEPIRDIHVYSDHSAIVPNVDVRYIYIFGLVAVLVLFIAAINYMNLATARAMDRGVEVGVRKVMGAQKNELFWQYINEAFLSVLLAFGLAWALCSLILPVYNSILEKNYTMDMLLNLEPMLMIGFVILLITFGAGAYPSLVMAAFKPSKILKGSLKSSAAGIKLRQGLITFQFIISAALIICSLVIYKQISYIRTTNLGYQKDHVVSQAINYDLALKFDVIKNSLEQFPQIEEITMANDTPVQIEWGDGITRPGGESVMVRAAPVEKNYLNTLNIELIAGKDFSEQDQIKAFSPNPDSLHSISRSVILNEAAVEALGWDNPQEAIGQKVDFKGNAEVAGVIRNFHFAPLHEEIGPLVLFIDRWYNHLLIRIDGAAVPEALDILEGQWSKISDKIPFDPKFINDEYDALYVNEQRLGQLSLFFTVLTIALSAMGLLGLSALTISHRIREIGIRKVLGASVYQIVNVLSKDFLKLVIVAFIIAIPLAYYALDLWLQSFTYKIDMPIEMFVLSGVLLIVVTVITLSIQTVMAANQNPTEILKSE